jgi:hypothetical protein
MRIEMPLNIDSYTTTAGTADDSRRIATAIKSAIISEDLDVRPESNLGVQSYGGFSPLFITGTYPEEMEIPLFAHPISILGIRGKNFICSDLRPFLKKDPSKTIKDRVTDRINFDYALSRNILNLLWAGGRAGEFITGFGYAGRVYGAWISQLIRGLGFNDLEAINARITAMAYYYMQCKDNLVWDAEEKQNVVDWIYSGTQLDESHIRSIVDQLKPMLSYSHLIDALKITVGGVRAAKISVSTISMGFASTWFGYEKNKVVSVAVEHPPTFAALVYSSLASKAFKGCLLAQVIDKTGRRNDHDSFIAHYNDICKGQIRLEKADVIHPLIAEMDYDGEKLAMESAARIPPL